MKWPVRAIGDPKRGLPFTAGSFAGSSRAEPPRELECHQFGAEILDLAGQVAELPLRVDQAWFLGALGAVADELHDLPSPTCR